MPVAVSPLPNIYVIIMQLLLKIDLVDGFEEKSKFIQIGNLGPSETVVRTITQCNYPSSMQLSVKAKNKAKTKKLTTACIAKHLKLSKRKKNELPVCKQNNTETKNM